MKRLGLILLVTSSLMMSGCTRTARLYPVQGPLSNQTPAQVFFAKISGGSFGLGNPAAIYPGNISVILSGGEIAKGHWAQVAAVTVPKGAAPASVPPTAGDLSSVWDTVYGQGYFVAHVLGTRYYYRAAASGNHGTVLDLEMYWDTGESNAHYSIIKGVAQDNRGNIYKVVL